MDRRETHAAATVDGDPVAGGDVDPVDDPVERGREPTAQPRDLGELLAGSLSARAARDRAIADQLGERLTLSLDELGESRLGMLQALSTAVERLHRAVREHDPQAFTEMMRRGHEYLQVRKAAREPAG